MKGIVSCVNNKNTSSEVNNKISDTLKASDILNSRQIRLYGANTINLVEFKETQTKDILNKIMQKILSRNNATNMGHSMMTHLESYQGSSEKQNETCKLEWEEYKILHSIYGINDDPQENNISKNVITKRMVTDDKMMSVLKQSLNDDNAKYKNDVQKEYLKKCILSKNNLIVNLPCGSGKSIGK